MKGRDEFKTRFLFICVMSGSNLREFPTKLLKTAVPLVVRTKHEDQQFSFVWWTFKTENCIHCKKRISTLGFADVRVCI